jgi:hypothetical protein
MRLYFCVLVFGLSSLADVITVGAPADAINGDPFAGPLPGFAGTRYQQAYASTDFPGPMAITSISFFNHSPFEGPLPVATYMIFLSTITSGIDTLSNTSFDANDGPDNTLFAFGDLGGLAPPQLVFAGRPFDYNPATGNLLMDIQLSNEGASGGAFYDARSGTATGVFSRYQNFSAGTHGFGLVTQFTFTSVPEPCMIALLIGGMGGLIVARSSQWILGLWCNPRRDRLKSLRIGCKPPVLRPQLRHRRIVPDGCSVTAPN